MEQEYDRYDLAHKSRDSYPSASHGRRCSNNNDHYRDHRRKPRQTTYPRADKNSQDYIVFNCEVPQMVPGDPGGKEPG